MDIQAQRQVVAVLFDDSVRQDDGLVGFEILAYLLDGHFAHCVRSHFEVLLLLLK